MELVLLPIVPRSSALALGVALLAGCAGPATPASAPPTAATPTPAAEAPENAPPYAPAESAGAQPPEATGDASRAPVTSSSAEAANPASTEADAGTKHAPTVPPGTKVLHIGDSMAGALGIELNAALKEAGATGILRYKTASFIPTWAWSRDLPVLLANHDPDLVLITLGTNEIRIEDPSIRAKTIRKLVGRLEGRPCVWIAPPLWGRGDTGLLPVIRDNCSPCVFMDTNALLPDIPRLRDKIHPTMKARRDWARFVLDWLSRQRDPNGKRPWDMKSVPPSASGPKQ